MKRTLYFALSALVTAGLLSSCKKKDDGTDDTGTGGGGGPVTVTRLKQDSIYDVVNASWTIVKYSYNSADQLMKQAMHYGGSATPGDWDTVIFASGKVDQVRSYNSGNPAIPYRTLMFHFNGSVLDSVMESGTNANGAYAATHLYQYSGGKLWRWEQAYRSGTPDPNDIKIVDSLAWTGGNATKGSLTMQSGQYMGGVTLEWDLSYQRPKKGWYVDNDILDMFCTNNHTKIFADAFPANPFEVQAYEYASGRVSVIYNIQNSGADTVKTYLTWETITK